MASQTPRTSFNSSRLIRVLSELTATGVADSKQSLAERLGLWLGWANAISLSAALNGHSAGSSEATASGLSLPARGAAGEFARVRAALAHAITTDELLAAGMAGQEVSTVEREAGFAPYRRCYAGHQRAMDAAISPLRAQVRAALGSASPRLGRLAALDAVLDEALGARERHLLSTVPSWLEKHFDALRKAPPEILADSGPEGRDPPSPPGAGWLAVYRKDMQDVLLAELDIRLQPVEGLIEALDHEITRQQ